MFSDVSIHGVDRLTATYMDHANNCGGITIRIGEPGKEGTGATFSVYSEPGGREHFKSVARAINQAAEEHGKITTDDRWIIARRGPPAPSAPVLIAAE